MIHINTIKGIILSFLLTKAVTTVNTRRMNSHHEGHVMVNTRDVMSLSHKEYSGYHTESIVLIIREGYIVVSYGNICGPHEKNVWLSYGTYVGYHT